MARWQWTLVGVAAWSGLCAAQAGKPLVVTFAGDLMAHTRNQTMPDYGDIYRALAPWLLTDDLSFVNLETPVDPSRPPSDYPSFNAKPAYAEAAIQGGFDVFSLANNHSNDFGASSIDGTLGTWEALGRRYRVTWSGLRHAAAQPLMPVVIEKRRWRVGFIALTNVINQYTAADRVNLVSLWDVWSGRVNPAGVDALVERVARWKTGLDVLVVSLHDGVEYAREPSAAQLEIYRRIVAAGADVLWCHHPHVLLPWAWLPTERGPRLVMFSMGNFVSRQTGRLGPGDSDSPLARRGDGALMRVKISRVPKVGVRLLPVPVLTNNFNDPVKGMLVVPTELLTAQAPAVWKAYFRRRLEAQQAWLSPLEY